MPIYNNPAIGQAFSQISQLFAPPSGSEAAGWAMANARNAEAQREAEAYARMTAPGVDPATVDRYGIATGAFAPAQSYGLTIRDQDINSADRRYGADRTFAASTENNARDNARALEAERVKTVAGLFGPLSEGQLRPEVPEAIAGRLGLDAAVAPAYGLPDPLSSDELVAQIMSGMPQAEQQSFVRDKFAPTESQVQGEERRRLAAGGMLSDEALLDTIVGERSPVQAIGPNGALVFMSPGAAIREGARPAPSSPSTVINNGPNGVPYGEPEKGTVWARNPDGTVKLDERGAPIAIPYQGGSVYREQQEVERAASSRSQSEDAQQAVVLQDIDRALDMIEEAPALTTGVGAQLMGSIGGSPAYDASALIDTIRANVGFDALQAMRDASPTGGALGQVTERELALLQARIGNLQTSQSAGQLQDNLKRVKNMMLDIVHGSDAGPAREPLSFAPQDAAAPDRQPAAGDGAIAVNPQTGERLILRNGNWEPLT